MLKLSELTLEPVFMHEIPAAKTVFSLELTYVLAFCGTVFSRKELIPAKNQFKS